MQSTRRDLLKLAGIAAASSQIPPIARAQSPKSMADVPFSAKEKIRLGVASYSLRKFKRAECISMVKACGTPYVNIKSMHLPYELTPEQLAAGRKEFDDAGLVVVGSGNNTMTKEAEIQKIFDYAVAAKFPLLVIAPHPDVLPKIEAAVKKTGIPVAIHNHGPEDKLWPSPLDVWEAVQKLDRRIGLCIDVGHTAHCGGDPVRAIRTCAERLYDVHIKDLESKGPKARPVEVGRGVLNIGGILAALREVNFAGHVGLEHEKDMNDPLPGVAESIGYIRGTLAAMRAR